MAKKELSPMMRHYKQLKEQYPDAIVMYRLGDFYEMFFEDAITASKILDLTLTGRDCGLEDRAPMCGVPHHAVDNYIAKLIEAGVNVAVCDQLTEAGAQKGLVERDVTRVITPGTVIEDDILDQKKDNYLASVYLHKSGYGLAYVDINAGIINVYQYTNDNVLVHLENFLQILSPSEIIANSHFVEEAYELSTVKAQKLPKPKAFYDYSFDQDNAESIIKGQMDVYSLEALGLDKNHLGVRATGALIDYIKTTQKRSLSHINSIQIVTDTSYMLLDYNTKRNLELTENLADHTKTGSLLWVLDDTTTNMGARALRRFLEEPLLKTQEVNDRLDAVEELYKNNRLRTAIKNELSRVRDLERLAGKISYNTITPRECYAIKETLTQIPNIKKLLQTTKSKQLQQAFSALNPLENIEKALEQAINPESPANLKDGGYIRTGYNADLDVLRNAKSSGNQWIKEFEVAEKERTGIKNLKVGYNRVFGYYIEISASQKHLAPYNYVRKQTLTTGERFITEELKQVEDTILGAAEKAIALEASLYTEIKETLLLYVKDFQQNARVLAYLDALISLASVAVKNNYVRPKVKDKIDHIKIKDGRHPVVEAFKKKNEFVSNDCTLNRGEDNVLIITGPNMAGKSTYMRQVALIVLMAQIGSFVPASSVEMGIVDRIFTRIGASDNLSQGQSTFMVEMIEVAAILANATKDSLLILDEIGRGTSTLDGLSIAWAIVEYLAKNIRAKTLFATHYHELSEIESLFSGVKNYHILINDTNGKITFLYKISRGGASKSFGIEVAGLAGVKKDIINRAKTIMKSLEGSHDVSGDLTQKLSNAVSQGSSVMAEQMNLFGTDKRLEQVEKAIKDIDINRITPIEALTILSDIKKLVEEN